LVGFEKLGKRDCGSVFGSRMGHVGDGFHYL
jgi:hypothetical protein